ncbi:hypothetical protein WDW37_20645 [Bdellovibrionota bacterium FG-1]
MRVRQICCLLGLIFSGVAHADARLDSSDGLTLLSDQTQYTYVVLNLQGALRQQLQELSIRQAFGWSDTILEGDYASSGLTRLDFAEGVYSRKTPGELLAYRITYSEKARNLSNCREGRISESSFVSLGQDAVAVDQNAGARFQ